jgi:hypothetical protein
MHSVYSLNLIILDTVSQDGEIMKFHIMQLSTITSNFISIITLTHGAEPILRSCQLCSHSRTSQNFMESEGLLPCSKELSTGPYSEPDQSNPYYPILSL